MPPPLSLAKKEKPNLLLNSGMVNQKISREVLRDDLKYPCINPEEDMRRKQYDRNLDEKDAQGRVQIQ